MRRADLIVPLTYGSSPQRLMRGTEEFFLTALQLLRNFPGAKLAFANPTHLFPDSDLAEIKKKLEFIAARSIEPKELIVGRNTNTINEATSIAEEVQKANLLPKSIVLVTGEVHSRSARYIWQRVFPGAEVAVVGLSHKVEVEADHVVSMQRNLLTWMLTNIARHLAVRTFGLRFVSRFNQPVKL